MTRIAVLGNRMLSLGLISVLLLSTTACTFDEVLSDINVMVQTANVICAAIGPVSPADSALCQTVAGVASTGLAVIQKDYQDWKSSGATTDLQKLEAAVKVLQQNLPQELAAAHISNAHAVQVATAWVGLITTTLTAVLNMLPGLQGMSFRNAQARATMVGSSMPTPETLQNRWRQEVCNGDAACGKLVKAGHIGHSRFVRIVSLGIEK